MTMKRRILTPRLQRLGAAFLATAVGVTTPGTLFAQAAAPAPAAPAKKPAAQRAGAARVTMNFVNQDIEAVTRAIGAMIASSSSIRVSRAPSPSTARRR